MLAAGFAAEIAGVGDRPVLEAVARLSDLVFIIVVFRIAGTKGANRYGPDPLSSTADLRETFS
jgi:uncharacterized membrane protein YhaH (DUF805 family)